MKSVERIGNEKRKKGSQRHQEAGGRQAIDQTFFVEAGQSVEDDAVRQVLARVPAGPGLSGIPE
jgi:hypothetical protein